AEANEVRGQHDGVACFTFLYHTITLRVWEGITSGRFADPMFIGTLDVLFANRFLSALRANALTPTAVPHAWAVLLDRRADSHITQLQFAACGVNAHVNYDLPIAVVDACTALGCAPGDGPQHESYQEINRIFAEEMQALRQHFESTWQRLVDRGALARVLDKINDWTVVADRDAAWQSAEHLWELRQRNQSEDPFVHHLDDVAGALGRAVLTPVL
ncbi:MAG TPA: DUF5995 family protein, partial [Actinomycetota bacterium]|nr:DUF5995 family protein [Actinomycetota bacterium]